MATALMKIWNVDQGLAVHIKCPDDNYIVIDLGSSSNVSPLRALKGENVKFMVFTHPHAGHFSDIYNINDAMPEVITRSISFTREELLSGARSCDIDKINRYCDLADEFNNPTLDMGSSDDFGGLSVKEFSTEQCSKSNINNFSSVVLLRLGRAKIVVCGDNETESLSYLMEDHEFKGTVESSCVLVAPHHGSESGYYHDFVRLVSPLLTVISDTKRDKGSASSKYREMSKGWDVLNLKTERYEKRQILTTSSDGDIEIEFGEDSDNHHKLILNVRIKG